MLLPRFSLLATPPCSTAELRGTVGSSVAALPLLLRVELDDQLLLDGHGDVVARRRRLDGALEAALVQVEPAGDAAAIHRFERLVDAHDLAALLLDRHHVADLHLEGGDVHLALVDAEVS